ncbi:hypothetical protein [Microbulbifer sp. TYP-18]|uniref:hypothetical protein n=1 Tax=Microbulbifer sp. TYP-18 TaxID=3230024 RepID=UPI0034C5FF30
MALWKQALAKLRGPAAAKSSGETAAIANSDGTGSPEGTDGAGVAGETPIPGDGQVALAQELRVGIEVSIGDLEPHPAGWRYRGHPVMVFGVDGPELTDGDKRREFFSLVHLHPCCAALRSDGRSAWVGTDLAAIDSSHGAGPFKLCRACLEAAGGRGADPDVFDFSTHVSSQGDSYFAENACFWQSGHKVRPLQAPPAAATGACPDCGCGSAAPGWQLDAEDARHLELPEGICVLCAERKGEGCLHLGGQLALEAASARYRDLVDRAAKAPVSSWKLVEAVLPLGWRPLLRSLQRQLPPPEPFYQYAESAPPAILAWPSLRRGIVAKPQGPDASGGDWRLWTRSQIEAELGFRPR